MAASCAPHDSRAAPRSPRATALAAARLYLERSLHRRHASAHAGGCRVVTPAGIRQHAQHRSPCRPLTQAASRLTQLGSGSPRSPMRATAHGDGAIVARLTGKARGLLPKLPASPTAMGGPGTGRTRLTAQGGPAHPLRLTCPPCASTRRRVSPAAVLGSCRHAHRRCPRPPDICVARPEAPRGPSPPMVAGRTRGCRTGSPTRVARQSSRRVIPVRYRSRIGSRSPRGSPRFIV